jgi:Na+-translocating ferredoxin:NAD+ oxidoreductase RnfG subunit
MAYIDLKQCQFFLEDGFSKTGAVNNAAGYAAGASVIAVDGFTGIIPVGAGVKFAGHATEYRVTAHTETSSNTTGVTISPVLTDAIVDNEVISFGPHILEITIGEGNLTFDEKRALEYKKNRGKLDQVRLGDEDPIDVNMQFAWEFLSSPSGAATPTC